MKNRDKYRDELMTANVASRLDFCEKFIKPKILSPLGVVGEDMDCANVNCSKCMMIQLLWLDDEYKEPEVDWNEVPIDTLVEVSAGDGKWFRRYFARVDADTIINAIVVWGNGKTSKTTSSYSDVEKYPMARLVEGGNE